MALKKEYAFALAVFCMLGTGLTARAAKAPGPKKANKSLELVKKRVQKKKESIDELKNEINELEESLGQGNKRYVSVVEEKQGVESRIYQLRDEVDKTKKELALKKEATENMLKRAVLNKLSTEADPAKLLAEKILFKGLGEKLSDLHKKIKQNKKEKNELDQLISDFQEYSQTEVELATFLNELENKKKSVVNSYLGEVQKEKELQKRFSKLKVQFAMARAKAQKNRGLQFEGPLKNFTKFEHEDKGVTFHYEGRSPVTSSAPGEVVYSGELSAYGNVVMIDHGNDTRSVVLGQFIPKVEKGIKVQSGDVLGYTSYNPRREKNSGKVYFEVRKKNKVQNTIELMNPSSLEREVLASR